MASELMSNEIALLAIFLLSVFVGFEVVSKVSTTLRLWWQIMLRQILN
jgi:NAD(P) transhydrogenase subunit alpha